MSCSYNYFALNFSIYTEREKDDFFCQLDPGMSIVKAVVSKYERTTSRSVYGAILSMQARDGLYYPSLHYCYTDSPVNKSTAAKIICTEVEIKCYTTGARGHGSDKIRQSGLSTRNNPACY